MDRSKTRPGALVLAGIIGSLVLASAAGGCRDATEIDVELTTDTKCADRPATNITVGQMPDYETDPPQTATTACTTNPTDPRHNQIGSIVVVPSGDKDDKVAIRVVTGLGKTAEACIADGYLGGCIVARRLLRFQPHQAIHLPIYMAANCKDVPCNATETCVNGQCVSAEIPDPDTCIEPGGCDKDAGGKDAAPDGKDASPDVKDAVSTDTSEGGQESGEPGPEPIPEAGPEPQPEAEAGPEPKPEPQPEAGPDVDPEIEPEAGPDVDPELDASPDEPEPEPEAGPDDAGPDAVPCADGTANCDNDTSNGCEATLATDPLNCGSCGNDCLGGTCTDSVCHPACAAGTADCDGIFANGCETDTTSSPTNCGACGTDCLGGACAGSVCHPVCAAGTADCDGIFANGCETDTTSSPTNCGACNHGCLGGACTASMCQPIEIATGQGAPTGIATDGVNVYFTDASGGRVMRMPVSGGSPVAIAIQSNPFWVATDGVEVFWTQGKGSGGVWKANVDGTGLMNLAAGQGNPKGLVIDATHVFWVNQWGSMNKVRRDGTELNEDFWTESMSNPMFVAADLNVFASNHGTSDNSGSIQAGAKITTAQWSPVTPVSNPMGIAADSVAMYYVTRGNGNAYTNGEVVMYVYPDAHAIAGPINDGWGVAVDPDWVYWTSQGDGRLERVRRDTTGRQVLITGLVAPRAIAVDSVAVYVASSGDGRILRIAR